MIFPVKAGLVYFVVGSLYSGERPCRSSDQLVNCLISLLFNRLLV